MPEGAAPPAEWPRLQVELRAAQEQVRHLAAAVQLTQEELARARKDLEDERARHAADDAPTGRAPSAQDAASHAGLRIHMLGATHIELDGELVRGAWLAQRAGQLLSLLVVHRERAVSGDEIAEALGSCSGVLSTGSVRSIVHELRDRLEPLRSRRAGSRFVLAGATGYRLDRTAVTVDVDEFETLARVGLSRETQTGDSQVPLRALERAVALYRGELLAEFRYAEWAIEERERLSQIAADCFRRLAKIHAAAGDLDHAIALLDRLVALDPLDGPTQRALIALCLRRGRYGRANRQYSLFQARLQRQFGERPDFELAELIADPA